MLRAHSLLATALRLLLSFLMWVKTVLRGARMGWHAFANRKALPGYDQLSWRERCGLDARTALVVWADPDCWRLLLWTLAYLLAIHVLAWEQDLQRRTTDQLLLLALFWVLPSVALLRRRAMRQLLGPHWPPD